MHDVVLMAVSAAVKTDIASWITDFQNSLFFIVLLGFVDPNKIKSWTSEANFILLLLRENRRPEVLFDFILFCHDSAKHASIMALAAPKSWFSLFTQNLHKILTPLRICPFLYYCSLLIVGRHNLCSVKKIGKVFRLKAQTVWAKRVLRFRKTWAIFSGINSAGSVSLWFFLSLLPEREKNIKEGDRGIP